MDGQSNPVEGRPSAAERSQASGATVLGRGGAAAVARGRPGTVSREPGVTAATLSGWREAFLAAGEAALASRAVTGEALESERLKAKLGAALIERDLLQEKIALLEAGRPFARRRRKPGAASCHRSPAHRTVWPRSAGYGGSPALVCIASCPPRRRRRGAGRSA